MADLEESRSSVTLHVQGAQQHINHAFGTTFAQRLRFAFPMSQVKIKHDHRVGDFVKRDLLNFDALRYDEMDILVVVGENPTLENSLIRPRQKTQDGNSANYSPAELMFNAIQKEAEQKAFDINQNSDNWFQYVPEHLKAAVTAYLNTPSDFPLGMSAMSEFNLITQKQIDERGRTFYTHYRVTDMLKAWDVVYSIVPADDGSDNLRIRTFDGVNFEFDKDGHFVSLLWTP